MDNTLVIRLIESAVMARSEEMIKAKMEPSSDPTQVLQDILLPLMAAARRGAESANWQAEVDVTKTDPTIWIRLWPTDKDRSLPASVMAYPQQDKLITNGIGMSYSHVGSNNEIAMHVLASDSLRPREASDVLVNTLRKALRVGVPSEE